jgi:GntR family transcriptional regulator
VLGKRLGIDADRARHMLQQLQTEGLVELTQKRSWRVKNRKTCSSLVAWHGFSREMAARGVAVDESSIDVHREPADELVCRALNIPENSMVLKVEQLFRVNRIPAVVIHSWVHPQVSDLVESNLASDDSQVTVTECLDQVCVGQETLYAIAADADEASLLQMPVGNPLFVRERRTLDAAGGGLEFSRLKYRADLFRHTISMRRTNH